MEKTINCRDCGVLKTSLNCYVKATGNFVSRCKVCECERLRKYYLSNSAKVKATVKKYRQNNPEKIKSNKQKWVEENKDASNGIKKRWRLANQAKIKEAIQRDRLKINKRNRDRHKSEISLRILKSLRTRIGRKVLERGFSKSEKTLKMLGCTIVELKNHLESKFTYGMDWDNYGFYGWHIDHIRPCSSFDLSDPTQQAECFHHTNLQPLWAEDNLRKGATYNEKG